MKIALLCVATGGYLDYAKQMFDSAKRYFCTEHDVSFICFTDKPCKIDGLDIRLTRPYPWPYSTMMRYECYKTINLKSYDFVYAIDADMLFHSHIGDNILSDSVAVIHPGYENKQPKDLPFDRNPNSHCRVDNAYVYYAGGFLGGSGRFFSEFCHEVSESIKKDISRGYIAKWHCESYINHYFWKNQPSLILPTSYCWAENHSVGEKYIEALTKDHNALRSKETLSVFAVSKDRPLMLENLLENLRDVPFNLTVLYLATNDQYKRAYEHVKRKCFWAKFIEQEARGSMRKIFLNWLKTASDWVLVTPEDNVFHNVDIAKIYRALQIEDLFGLTLRLHPGINKSQTNEHPFTVEKSGEIITYKPHESNQSQWGYVWEMSSTLYRKNSLETVVRSTDFSTINELESFGLKLFNNRTVNKMACLDWAPVTNIFVDTGFKGSEWCLDERTNNETLLHYFHEGRKIDTEATFNFRDQEKTTHVKKLFLKSKGLKNSAIIVVPCRNMDKFVISCMESINQQDYPDIGVVFIDDCSTDATLSAAQMTLKKPAIFLSNKDRKYAMKNIYDAIVNHIENENAVVFLLDGDDMLIGREVVSKIMEQHKTHDVVWSDYQQSDGVKSISGPLLDLPVRKQPWCMSHLKTFKRRDFLKLKESDFKDEKGDWIKTTYDQAIMLPLAESVGHTKCYFYPEKLYYYRRHGENDDLIFAKEQKRIERIIRRKGRKNTITVVISYYKQKDTLPLILESLYYQTMCPDSVIVADDGSNDQIEEWIKTNKMRYPFSITYIGNSENQGFGLAEINNKALETVKTERVIFTNADMVLSPDFVKHHLMATGVAGTPIKSIEKFAATELKVEDLKNWKDVEELQNCFPGERDNGKWLFGRNPLLGVWGGAFSVDTEVAKSVGGFWQEKKYGGEDFDLATKVFNKCQDFSVVVSHAYHLDHERKNYTKKES